MSQVMARAVVARPAFVPAAACYLSHPLSREPGQTGRGDGGCRQASRGLTGSAAWWGDDAAAPAHYLARAGIWLRRTRRRCSDLFIVLASSVNLRCSPPNRPRISRQKQAAPASRTPVTVTAISLLRTGIDHALNRFRLTSQVLQSRFHGGFTFMLDE